MAESAVVTPQVESSVDPSWYSEMAKDWRAGIATSFMLHGNVFDVNNDGLSLVDFLMRRIGKSFDFVVYSPDQGIQFPGPSDTVKLVKKRLKSVLTGASQSERKMTDAERLLSKQNANQPFQGGGEDLVLPQSPSGAITALIDFLEQSDPQRNDNGEVVGGCVCVIIDRMDLICPPGDKAVLSDSKSALLSLLHRAGTSRKIDAREGMLLMLSPSLEEVHSDLRSSSSHIRAIHVPLPNFEDRRQFARRCIERHGVSMADGVTIGELASQTAGLGRRHIEDVTLCAVNNNGIVTRDLIRERKKILLAAEYAEVLEVLETDVTMDMVGGHRRIKDYLQTYVIDVLLNDNARSYAPLSLAFLGPSGVGKTFVAQALSNSIGWNCVLLRPEKTKGGIVGESERRLRKALDGIEALAPCVVFLDEIDQGGRRSEGTAGGGGDAVEANAFGAMLEFFGDQSHRGKILTIMASNRPDLIDPAFLRPGRTDDKFPFLPPESSEERADALTRLIRRHCGVEASQAQVMTIGDKTENWTQAELERLVLKARAISEITGVSLPDALTQAQSRLVTSTRDIWKMTVLALQACDDLALVPEKYHSLVGRGEMNGSDDAGGTPDGRGSEKQEPLSRGARTLRDLSKAYDAIE